jgi:SH3 domain protein
VKKVLLILILCCPGLLQAALQKGYVTDKLEIQMRTGPSLQHKIVKMLPSGTPVTVLYQNAENGYSQVRLENGDEGWILTRYFSEEPLARTQLDDAIRKLEAITEENKRIKGELTALKAGKEGTDKAAQQLHTDNERLNTELNAVKHASANALQIQAERDRLQETVINLERELDATRRAKQVLDDDYRQDWFLIGAGVLFGGMVLGWILPRLSWRKKTSWSSF